MGNNIKHSFVVLAYKESPYLENCIQSVLSQSNKSDVVIATSTYNGFIQGIADKYGLKIIQRLDSNKGIGYDFDFAWTCVDSDLVTIAHQDDQYDYTYAEKMIQSCKDDSIIVFPDYYEIRNGKKVFSNTNLKIKRILLFPLHFACIAKTRFGKRFCLAFGDAISCPSVTFVRKNIPVDKIFESPMKTDIDWPAWERLSNYPGCFSFVNEPLMGHRVHEESETSNIINSSGRYSEDVEILEKFWPRPIAKIIAKLYSNSEKSNTV